MEAYLADLLLKVGKVVLEIMISILRTTKVGYFLSIKKPNIMLDLTKNNLLSGIRIIASVSLEMVAI
jgi:hypothetical protein